jgi:hypothetical protein
VPLPRGALLRERSAWGSAGRVAKKLSPCKIWRATPLVARHGSAAVACNRALLPQRCGSAPR